MVTSLCLFEQQSDWECLKEVIICALRWYDKAPHLDKWGVAVGNTLLLINLSAPTVCTCVCVRTPDTPNCVCRVFEERDSGVSLLSEDV